MEKERGLEVLEAAKSVGRFLDRLDLGVESFSHGIRDPVSVKEMVGRHMSIEIARMASSSRAGNFAIIDPIPDWIEPVKKRPSISRRAWTFFLSGRHLHASSNTSQYGSMNDNESLSFHRARPGQPSLANWFF